MNHRTKMLKPPPPTRIRRPWELSRPNCRRLFVYLYHRILFSARMVHSSGSAAAIPLQYSNHPGPDVQLHLGPKVTFSASPAPSPQRLDAIGTFGTAADSDHPSGCQSGLIRRRRPCGRQCATGRIIAQMFRRVGWYTSVKASLAGDMHSSFRPGESPSRRGRGSAL